MHYFAYKYNHAAGDWRGATREEVISIVDKALQAYRNSLGIHHRDGTVMIQTQNDRVEAGCHVLRVVPDAHQAVTNREG